MDGWGKVTHTTSSTISNGDKHLHATYQTHLDFHAWIPPKAQANTKNLEQKAFAINPVSSSLYNQTSQEKEFELTTLNVLIFKLHPSVT